MAQFDHVGTNRVGRCQRDRAGAAARGAGLRTDPADWSSTDPVPVWGRATIHLARLGWADGVDLCCRRLPRQASGKQAASPIEPTFICPVGLLPAPCDPPSTSVRTTSVEQLWQYHRGLRHRANDRWYSPCTPPR